jgi:hypothetical protein
MNNLQRAKHDSIKRMLASSDDNAAKLTDLLVPGFQTEKTKLIAKEKQIDDAGKKQALDISGAVDNNLQAKKVMARLAVKFGLRGAVSARNAGNHLLAEQLGHYVNYVLKAPKGVAAQRAGDIADALENNLSVCVNVTQPDVDSIKAAIIAFKAIETDPVSLIEEKKAAGTDLLPGLFKEADVIIENMYNLVYSYYAETDPALVNEFYLAMQIIDTGMHHTGLMALCVNADPLPEDITNALEKVEVKIVELNLIAHSDIMGLAGFVKVKPGIYHVTFSLEGFITKTIIIQFIRGRTKEIEVELQKVPKPA